MSNPNIFMYWDSYSTGIILVYEDQEQTIPMDLRGADLLLIAKKRVADPDNEAVFSLTLAEGLALDTTDDHNQVSYQIPAGSTVGLPRTKNTTLWAEFIREPNDPVYRQTVEQFPLPVRPSIKEATEELS